jgi:hypothetical protein
MGSVSATWSSAIATSQKKSLLTLPAPSRAEDCTATAVPLHEIISSAVLLTVKVMSREFITDQLSQIVTASETCRAKDYGISCFVSEKIHTKHTFVFFVVSLSSGFDCGSAGLSFGVANR